jgi:antitoxin ParD1/3/4
MDGSVNLGRQIEDTVSDLVARGTYASREDVLRAGVKMVAQREAKLAELDAAIAEGVADADAGRTHSTEEVVAFLREELRKRPSA